MAFKDNDELGVGAWAAPMNNQRYQDAPEAVAELSAAAIAALYQAECEGCGRTLSAEEEAAAGGMLLLCPECTARSKAAHERGE